MDEKYSGRYDDIIDMPHHVSRKHKAMPVSDRAAQFSPFAALTGHSAAIAETARQTQRRVELDENAREELDRKLQTIMNRPGDIAEVKITYFRPDSRKSGGEYVDISGNVSRLDTRRRRIIMADGREIPVDDIVDMTL